MDATPDLARAGQLAAEIEAMAEELDDLRKKFISWMGGTPGFTEEDRLRLLELEDEQKRLYDEVDVALGIVR